MTKLRILPIVTLVSLSAAHAATVMPGISSISFTGTATPNPTFGDNANNLIDGSGMTAAPTFANYLTVTHNDAAAGNMWTTTDPTPSGGDFYADSTATVVFEITLDNTYSLTDFVNWGYDFGGVNNNIIKSATFDYGVGDFTGGNFTLAAIARPNTASNAVVTSFAPVTADRVRITITDNYFGVAGGSGGDRVSLAEIRFLGDAVPEPSTALLGGVAFLGLLRRRRG